MALKGADALAALDASAGVRAARNVQLPELDGLVETTRDQITAVGRERDRVHTVLVAIRALQALHQIAGGGVPDAHALVQRTRRDIVAVRRHGHSGHAVFDAQSVDQLAIQNIPKTNSLITTAGSDVPPVTSEIKRVDILFMSSEDVLDRSSGNIPNLYASQFRLSKDDVEISLRESACPPRRWRGICRPG